MSRLGPENILRQAVAELIEMHTDDVTAILEALTAGERQRVETLLHDLAGRFEQTLASSTRFDVSQLSPWLVSLLEQTGTEDGGMTAEANQALQTCATELFPIRGAA